MRPRRVEPKSAREERSESQSWNTLRESENPVYDIAREHEDVFPDKIPAELPLTVGFGTRLISCQVRSIV